MRNTCTTSNPTTIIVLYVFHQARHVLLQCIILVWIVLLLSQLGEFLHVSNSHNLHCFLMDKLYLNNVQILPQLHRAFECFKCHFHLPPPVLAWNKNSHSTCISMSICCPCAPPSGWWIIICEFGRLYCLQYLLYEHWVGMLPYWQRGQHKQYSHLIGYLIVSNTAIPVTTHAKHAIKSQNTHLFF